MAETLALSSSYPAPVSAARSGGFTAEKPQVSPFKSLLKLSNAQKGCSRVRPADDPGLLAGVAAPSALTPAPPAAPATAADGNAPASPQAALSALEGSLFALAPGATAEAPAGGAGGDASSPAEATDPAAPSPTGKMDPSAMAEQTATAVAARVDQQAGSAVVAGVLTGGQPPTPPAPPAASDPRPAATAGGATTAVAPTPAFTVIAATAGDSQPADAGGSAQNGPDRDRLSAPFAPAGGAARPGVWKQHAADTNAAPAVLPVNSGAASAASAAQAAFASTSAPAQTRTGAAGWAGAATAKTASGAGAAFVDAATAPDAVAPVKTIDQVADALVMTVRAGRSEATISLRPAALGEVRAQISAGPNGLVIRLSAEHAAVGDLLRARVAELREALTGQQIAVSELHVLHNPPAAATAGTHDGAAWQERKQPRPSDDPTQGQRQRRQQQDDDEADRG